MKAVLATVLLFCFVASSFALFEYPGYVQSYYEGASPLSDILLQREETLPLFTTLDSDSSPYLSHDAYWADIDNDGDLDLITLPGGYRYIWNDYDNYPMTMYVNNGRVSGESPSFTSFSLSVDSPYWALNYLNEDMVDYDIFPAAFSIGQWIDFDADGDLDFIYRNDNDYIQFTVLENALGNDPDTWSTSTFNVDTIFNEESKRFDQKVTPTVAVKFIPGDLLYSPYLSYYGYLSRPLMAILTPPKEYYTARYYGNFQFIRSGLYYSTGGDYYFYTGLPEVMTGTINYGDFEGDGDIDLLITGVTVDFFYKFSYQFNSQAPAKKDAKEERDSRNTYYWNQYNWATEGETIGTVSLLLNRGDLTFAENEIATTSYVPLHVQWADYNKDGYLDILSVAAVDRKSASVVLQRFDPHQGQYVNVINEFEGSQISTPSHEIYYLSHNSGNDGVWNSAAAQIFQSKAVFVDYDLDGDLDIAISYSNLDCSDCSGAKKREEEGTDKRGLEPYSAVQSLTLWKNVDGQFVRSPFEIPRANTNQWGYDNDEVYLLTNKIRNYVETASRVVVDFSDCKDDDNDGLCIYEDICLNGPNYAPTVELRSSELGKTTARFVFKRMIPGVCQSGPEPYTFEYTLTRMDANSNSKVITSGSVTDPSLSFSNLRAGTTYTLSVRGDNDLGWGEWLNIEFTTKY